MGASVRALTNQDGGGRKLEVHDPPKSYDPE
jgi:hypothetical protein